MRKLTFAICRCLLGAKSEVGAFLDNAAMIELLNELAPRARP
jgi:hypothetical protein